MYRRQFLPLLVAPVLLRQRLAGQAKVSDDELYDKVRLRLASDRDVRGMAIEVSVRDGVVTLRGRVSTEKARRRAERLTRKIKGVVDVVNELRVAPL